MTRIDYGTGTPSRRSRALVALRLPGTGAPSLACRARLAAGMLLLLIFALPMASASADGRIGSSEGRAEGAGEIASPRGLAVSQKESGDIYVADSFENDRVDQFHSDGTFVRAFGWKVNATAPEEKLQSCTTATGCRHGSNGSGPGQFSPTPAEIAVDNDPGTLAEPNPSYGDLYVTDSSNFRVEKFDPEGHFLLMFGGEVDKTTGADVCTAADIAGGDTCGAGLPGTGPAHFYESGTLSWGHEHSNSIAVGPGGTVYVGDYGRIQEFEPSGAFLGEFKLPLEAGEEPQFVTALAVDGSGDIYEHSATYNQNEETISQVPGVRKYNPAHALLETFDAQPGSESTLIHIALDSAGDLFVNEFEEAGGPPPPAPGTTVRFRAGFRAFKPSGALYAEFSSDQVENEEGNAGGEVIHRGNRPLGIAVGDTAGKLYATSFKVEGGGIQQVVERYIAVIPLPAVGPPTVAKEEATNLEPTTATLGATVNPEGFDTTYHFEYGTTAAYGHSSASTDLGPVIHEDPVSTAISPLTPFTTYHYRAVAESECEPSLHPGQICVVEGPDQSFETLPPVSVRDFTTQTVGPELVKLKAQLSPNNGTATHYTICIGEEEGSNALGCSEREVHVLGNEFEEVTAIFEHLKSSTEYHYRLTAHNDNGEVETADQSFTTEPSAAEERDAEDCPANGTVHGAPGGSTLREENSSLALPDCRSYEQVSALNKEGGEAFATASLAPGGERVLYSSTGVFAGALVNEATVLYLAQHTATGWVSQPAIGRPAGSASLQPTTTQGQLNFSPELDRWLFAEVSALNQNEGFHFSKSLFLSMGLADGSYVLHASPEFNVLEGRPRDVFTTLPMTSTYDSDDLSRLFIVTETRLLASDPRPDNLHTASQPDRIYELSGIGGPDPAITLVAEVPLGLIGDHGTCLVNQAFAGDNQTRQNYSARLISRDGSTIVYSAPIETEAGDDCGPGTPNPLALFSHQAGQSTSRQLNAVPSAQCEPSSPCHGAAPTAPTFDGLSADGARAFFTTAQPLIDSDTDNSGDLYLARLHQGEVTELVQASAGEANLSHPTPGEGAGVQGAIRVSEDGSHVSFVATGVLTANPDQTTGEAAEQGADNLYVYDADSGQIKFVARLCSGPGESAFLADPGCPASLDRVANKSDAKNDSGLWNVAWQNSPDAAFTPEGRYLVLRSFGRLTPDDTDNAPDLYRYDFQSGRLIRLSFGRDGNDDDGNDDAYPVELNANTGENQIGLANQRAEDSNRYLAEDGSTVIFETAAPLVSRDTNALRIDYQEPLPVGGLCGLPLGCYTGNDVYEWEEAGHGSCQEARGCVRLVSDGVDPHGASDGIISSSGRDVTFHSPRGEVPGDSDGVGDIYDARVEGGFHYVPPPIPCGSTEICHPAPSPPPPSPKITTPEFVGPGNGKQQLACGKGRHRVTKHGQVRCVPNKHHKAKKHHKRAAGRNRGGAK